MVNEDASLHFTLFCALPQSGNRKSSSLKNEVFLRIFTRFPKTCLWSRFISLTLHFTCEDVHFIRLWSFLPAGVWIVFLFTALHTAQPCFIKPPFQMKQLHFIPLWSIFRYHSKCEAFALLIWWENEKWEFPLAISTLLCYINYWKENSHGKIFK